MKPRARRLIQYGSVYWTKSEPILSKIQRILRIESRPTFPPTSASLRRAKQKIFRYIFYFGRTKFFLLKGKQNFFAGLCSERVGRRGWLLILFARAWRDSPPTPSSRHSLAWTDGIFGGDICIILLLSVFQFTQFFNRFS